MAKFQILQTLSNIKPSLVSPLPNKPTPLFPSSISVAPPWITRPSSLGLGLGLGVRLFPRASASFNKTDNIGEILGDESIFKATGESVMFKDLWDQNEGITVVALLRHFGCPCCWELASTLKESMARFDSANVKLIAVGVGSASKARILADRGFAMDMLGLDKSNVSHSYCADLPFPMEYLYADPERKAYDVLGLYYGFGRTFFNPASAKVLSRFDSIQKAVKNYTIEATPDDRSGVLQQGGMFVFKGNRLLYARKDEGTGDHAPLDDVFDVCCKVPVA